MAEQRSGCGRLGWCPRTPATTDITGYGVSATDGDIGIIQTAGGLAKLNPDGSLTRFGGIVVSTGGVNGQVIALGNAFGVAQLLLELRIIRLQLAL